ncbi:MAG: hypothetical protein IKO51_09905, partial [Clostridia bacterium]|nr:hypothetical protein [Clostridia bacterium]
TMPFFQTAGRLKITFDLSICVFISLSIDERFLVSLYGFQGAVRSLSQACLTIILIPRPFVKPFFHISINLFLHLFFVVPIDFFDRFGPVSGSNIFYILLDISDFLGNTSAFRTRRNACGMLPPLLFI